MPFDHYDIPVEVFEGIIDQAVGHPGSLKAISLTCRMFLPRARCHLFHRMLITSREHGYRLSTILPERPWLVPLVRVLAFDPVAVSLRYPDGVFEIIPVPLLTQFPNLYRLELVSSSSPPSLSLSGLTLNALRKYSAPIRHLQLDYVFFSGINDLVRYLSAFPNLSHLACITCKILERANASLIAHVLSRYKLKLTHLVVSPSIDLTWS